MIFFVLDGYRFYPVFPSAPGFSVYRPGSLFMCVLGSAASVLCPRDYFDNAASSAAISGFNFCTSRWRFSCSWREIQSVWGWSGGAKVLGKLPVPGRPTNLDNSGARVNCA